MKKTFQKLVQVESSSDEDKYTAATVSKYVYGSSHLLPLQITELSKSLNKPFIW